MRYTGPARWLRDSRKALASVRTLWMGRVPDAPALPVRDPWPGDPGRGAKLLVADWRQTAVAAGPWGEDNSAGSAHGFVWLRDMRALGTDAARLRARTLVAEWVASPPSDPVAYRPDVIGSRIASWLGHYDFFAATADDALRQKLMTRLVSDARELLSALPPEEADARSLTALKGLIAAAIALPGHTGLLNRALRFLPREIDRQVLPDGCHAERSPATQLSVLQDLIEMRVLLQAGQISLPPSLASAIDRMAPALRVLRHGDGGLALFNGTKEGAAGLIDLVLTQAGRGGRGPSSLIDGGFQRLQAGRTTLIIDCGLPPPAGLDERSHAGTLSFELSIGRERLVVNCGGCISGSPEWREAARTTAAHSTLIVNDTNSSEISLKGLGRRVTVAKVQRQMANGAHWLEAHHNGWESQFGVVHRRRLYMAENGDDIRGEDSVEGPAPQSLCIRFHLHPDVTANLQHNGDSVLLRLRSGNGWRLRAEGARLDLEESVYLGGHEPRRTEQVVLIGDPATTCHVRWAISRIG